MRKLYKFTQLIVRLNKKLFLAKNGTFFHLPEILVPLDKCRPLQNVSMDRCFNTNRTMQVEADKEMQTHKDRSTNRWSLLAGWPPMEAKQGEALSEARPR